MRDKKLHPRLTLAIIVLVVVLAAATAVVWSKQLADSKDAKQNATTAQTDKKPESQSSTLSYDGVEGKNALELLKTKARVVTKQSSYGEYVDSVNGVQGGTDGKYWAFYVNGQMAQVGAADYQTKEGDKITWKFE